MNTNNEYMNDDLLVKYLTGEATAAEERSVLNWVAADAANKKHFDHFSLIWNESKKLEGKTTITTDAAWARFMDRLAQDDNNSRSVPLLPGRTRPVPLFGLSWVRAAAVLVLMVGAALLVYTWNGNGSGQMLAQTFDKVMVYTLPDGSVVTLNKHSELSYPAHFDGHTRTVALKGEAFFSITPDKNKPFIIDAGNSSVKVVGTSFNVKNRQNVTEVIVETGIVEVAARRQAIRLQPGQKATVTTATAPVTENVTDELYNYYRTNEFVCNAVPLHKVVATLNDAYNAHIVIEGSRLSTLPLTATFPNESLDNILEVIAKTFKDELVVEKKGSDIILRER